MRLNTSPSSCSCSRSRAVMLLLLAMLASPLVAAQPFPQMPPMQPMPQLPGMQPWLPALQPMQPMQPMQPLPPLAPLPPLPAGVPGMTASASAVSNGPGSASSLATNNNGATGGFTTSSGNGVAASSTTTSIPNGCQRVSQSTSGGCQGGPCCSISQEVTKCKSYTTAVANINGAGMACCVILLKLPNKTPVNFCAAPPGGQNYQQMPHNTVIELKPSCQSGLGSFGSLACTVTFDQLPPGYTFPAGYTPAKPMAMWAGKPFAGYLPCNSGRFKRMIQVVSRTSPLSLTTKCE